MIYCTTGDVWDRTKIDINDSFICMIAENLSCEKDDPEPRTIQEAMRRSDWPKWKAAIEEEYASLNKRQVLGPIEDNLTS